VSVFKTLAAEGRSLREIAREIGVSHETVRRHLALARPRG
jgi:DNA-binding CsgD family transcriptional regulator